MTEQVIPPSTLELIAKLSEMHPEFIWGTHQLSDYDQYSIGSPPEVLICFSREDIANCEYIPDAFSTFYGEQCDPSHWSLSAEAAGLIRDHNQIAVAGPLSENESPMTYREFFEVSRNLLLANPGKALLIADGNVAYLVGDEVCGASLNLDGTPDLECGYDFDGRSYPSEVACWDGETPEHLRKRIQNPTYIDIPAGSKSVNTEIKQDNQKPPAPRMR